MKTVLSNGCPLWPSEKIARLIIPATVLFWAVKLHAMPRGPWPPYPESPPLYHESFDVDYFFGQTNSELFISGLGLLDESWSGYALQRTGESVAPFVIPALNSDGTTNVASDAGGSFRLWVKPWWSSGASNGSPATLVELDAASGVESAYAWSLQVSADGNTVELFNQTDSGVQEVLSASIAWQAGTSHSVVLDFGPQATALFLDGVLVAQETGLVSVPLSVGQLVLGSTLSGTNTAGADFDEFYSFGDWQTETDVSAYYGMTSTEVALGPMAPWEEDGNQNQRRDWRQIESIHSPGNVFDPNHVTPCSPGGPFYITNFVVTAQTNGMSTVNFDIFGGTNGVFYDIFTTGSLNNSLASNQWLWIGQGLTCNNFTFTNQPANQAFYELELPGETFTVAFDGDNDYGQCNVPSGLSNSIAVAAGGFFSLALRNNGTLVAWGDNSHGETNIPAGLTNVVAIAAGEYHGVAVLANGAVTNWGWYSAGDEAFCSVTDRTNASAPPTSGVVAVAAGDAQDLALLSNGTCVVWGVTSAAWVDVPTNLNLTNVSAIACGWRFNVALSSNGTVTAWGYDAPGVWNLTNVPGDLTTNVAAIAAGGLNSLALRTDGTVEGWGDAESGDTVTDVPSGLSNVVAIATSGQAGMALKADGSVVAWGESSLTNIPAGMAGVKAISAGFDHNLVIESGLLTPVIFSQPASQYAPAGGTATFSAIGEGVAGVQYQWQFNGVNVTGATNATLTLTNTQATNNGSYQVIVSTAAGSITSSLATFTLIVPPQIGSVTPAAADLTWIADYGYLSVAVTNAGLPAYSMDYQWRFNGTYISGATLSYYPMSSLTPTNEGNYTVIVTDAAGSTNISWNVRLALPGMVESWGDNTYEECNRPGTLTNALAVAAGEDQSIAVTETGTVVQWGKYWDGAYYYSVTNYSAATVPPSSNVLAVAAGVDHAIALLTNGTVVTWGLTNSGANYVPTNLPPAKAVGCGWAYNAALLTNGTVVDWGDDLFGETNVPAGLSNVVAIATGAEHCLALLASGTVQAWGDGFDGDTNVPAGLSNVVAIAAGLSHNLALKSDGTVVAWGLNNYGQTNVPAGLSNVMAVAAGDYHSVALVNDGTVVSWGDNSSGQAPVISEEPTTVVNTIAGSPPSFQTITIPPIVVKQISAGGDHTMAAVFLRWAQYPIDVSKDLLLIYNSTNISGSSNVCAYYLTHRPMVSHANVLGISCNTNEQIGLEDYTNTFSGPIVSWLTNNPTKRPQYVILFQDLPSKLQDGSLGIVSVQYDMNSGFNSLFQIGNYFPSWTPFVTSINMNGVNGTNDCIAYINKIASMASSNPPGSLFISAITAGYGNTNWYFDLVNPGDAGVRAEQGVTNSDPSAPVFGSSFPAYITSATNVAGYYTGGWDGGHTTNYALDGTVLFRGNSEWYVMACTDSYDGERPPVPYNSSQASFITWFNSNAFGGTNYCNTPVGVITYVFEPGGEQQNLFNYYGNWAAGEPFVISAWYGSFTVSFGGPGTKIQAVGDPFVTK